MKTKIIFVLLLASVVFLSAYERVQVSRYAHRYTRLTDGVNVGLQGIIIYSIIIKNLNVDGK